MWNGSVDVPDCLRVPRAELCRRPGQGCNRHSCQQRRCGYSRLRYDRCGTAMAGKIGEIDLRQDKDQGKQEQFEKEDAPTPSLHTSSPRELDFMLAPSILSTDCLLAPSHTSSPDHNPAIDRCDRPQCRNGFERILQMNSYRFRLAPWTCRHLQSKIMSVSEKGFVKG